MFVMWKKKTEYLIFELIREPPYTEPVRTWGERTAANHHLLLDQSRLQGNLGRFQSKMAKFWNYYLFFHILKITNFVCLLGALAIAERARERTSLVLQGEMIPSSHRRAVL